MPSKRSNVKNEKQYEALKDKGMSKERAAKISNSSGSSSRGGRKSGSSSPAPQYCRGPKWRLGARANFLFLGRVGAKTPTRDDTVRVTTRRVFRLRCINVGS